MTEQGTRALPLDGVTVVDLSRFIAGPLCAMLLGDMGADVIKVERPGGEDSRSGGPQKNGESIYTSWFNRNKRGITLNLRQERARELLRQILLDADVVVENFRPGTMEKMGFGLEQLREINPDIVLTSISGFGQTGPLRERAAFDAIAQAMAGLMWRSGQPADEPMLTGTFIADHISALYATIGTLVALFERQRVGAGGQQVDVALLDGLFSCMGIAVPAYAMNGEVMTRNGNRDQFVAPSTLVKASDGHVFISAGSDALFDRLCWAIGRPELKEDPRFGSVEARMGNGDAVEAVVEDWAREHTVAEVALRLEDSGIPFGPVHTIPEIVEHPQIRAREMLIEVEHPEVGPVTVPGITAKLSESPGSVRLPPPMVGEHTASVLAEYGGVTERELAELREQGVV